MSNIQRIQNLEQVVYKTEADFNKLAQAHGAVNFMREASFAMQILKDNDYLMGVALENQDSLKMAIVNVAAIGLTLNPIRALAYLIPRKRKVVLDVSYRGKIQLAADCGALAWAKPELVYEKDIYVFKGAGHEPIHTFEPFKPRGKIIGGYLLSKFTNSEFMIEHMTIDQIYKARDRSDSWKAYKSGKSNQTPWVDDETEMMKKTLVRYGSKIWPMTDKNKRWEKALEIESETDPIELTGEIGLDLAEQIRLVSTIKDLLQIIDRDEEKFISHLKRAFRRKIEKLEDLTEGEANSAIVMLKGFIESVKKSEKKK